MATLIVVSDMAGPAAVGRGGLAVYLLQHLHGLERLGHTVFFIEFLPELAIEDRTPTIDFFRDIMVKYWHADQSALILGHESLFGVDSSQIRRLAAEAAAIITIAAPYQKDPFPWLGNIRPRILFEQDPGYTHLWATTDDPAAIFGEHDFYFTVGANIGSGRCALPTHGIRWQPAWNPVVLDWWSREQPIHRDRFTTIADWRGYGYLEFEGQILGPKAEEFRKFIELPQLCGETVELALHIDPDDPDIPDLHQYGWHLAQPTVASDPERYRNYIAGSVGEFSCAKGGYVGTHCGWFSDRSACYLAAGRPVVLQATGFQDVLPTGQGLFAVATVEEAADAIKAIRRDYATHSAAARTIAREYFDSDKVLSRVLLQAGIGVAS